MANEIPDFRPNRQIDINAVVNALAQKRQAEAQLQQQEDAKNARLNMSIQSISANVGNMISGLIERSKDKQFNKIKQEMVSTVEKREDLTPVGEGEPANIFTSRPSQTLPVNPREAELFGEFQPSAQEVPTAQMAPIGQTPEYQQKMQSLALQLADKKTLQKEAAEAAFRQPTVSKPPFAGKSILFVNQQGEGRLVEPDETGGLIAPEGFQEAGFVRSKFLGEPRMIQAETSRMRAIEDHANRYTPSVTQAASMKNNYLQLQRSDAAAVLVQTTEGNPPRIQMKELGTSILSIVQGGGSTGRVAEKLISDFTPDTFVGTVKQKLSWLTNKALPTDQQSFIEQFNKTIIGESANIERNIRDTQAKQYMSLSKRYTPEEIEVFALKTGLDPKRIKKDKNGQVRYDTDTPGYESILPNFNPFAWTPKTLSEGDELLTPLLRQYLKKDKKIDINAAIDDISKKLDEMEKRRSAEGVK